MFDEPLPSTTDCRAAVLEYANSIRQEDPELFVALTDIAQKASQEFVYQIASALRNDMKQFYLKHTAIALTLLNVCVFCFVPELSCVADSFSAALFIA